MRRGARRSRGGCRKASLRSEGDPAAADKEDFGGEANHAGGRISSGVAGHFLPDRRQLWRRNTREFRSQLVGHVPAERPVVIERKWNLDVELQQTLARLSSSRLVENLQQLSA